MSIQVKSIDEVGIKNRLKKSDCKICQEALQLIEAHERVYEINAETRRKAIKKIREQAKQIKQLEETA